MSDNVKVRPAGRGWVWVEEFGGGEWAQYPVRPLDTVRAVLKAVLYGPAYQAPASTRSTTGVWTVYFPTAGCR